MSLYRQFRLVRAALLRLKPDLIRAHNPWHAGLLATAGARGLDLPVIVSLHTHYGRRRKLERRPILQLLKFLERYSISRADKVLCVSRYLVDYARQMGANSTEVIYNRVYTSQFAREQRPRNKRPVILSVGRLDPPKDQECLIRAIVGLDVDLELVGDGENRTKLENLVRDLKLQGQVRFVGAVNHADIQACFARADIFALATYYEGFCIPVLEAMASGLPVVVNYIEPLVEILGGTGYTVEHTPEGFRGAISQLLGNPESIEDRSRAAFERAVSLDGTIMESREAALYARLINGSE